MGGILRKGQVLMEGFVDTGDLVLVDKFSYHFRKPERGEVFVFETLGIKGIKERSGPQGGGSHYIKRLVGVPGDSLTIRQGRLRRRPPWGPLRSLIPLIPSVSKTNTSPRSGLRKW